jgi:hydrogenase nickel incorporation protein HypA/HybF
MSIVEALIEQVEAEIEKAGGGEGRVHGLDLVIGRLSGVHVDSIEFAFELLSPGTVVEGAELRVSRPPAVVKCHACASRQPIEEMLMNCPDCGSGEVTIEGGQELLLQSIELEQPGQA